MATHDTAPEIAPRGGLGNHSTLRNRGTLGSNVTPAALIRTRQRCIASCRHLKMDTRRSWADWPTNPRTLAACLMAARSNTGEPKTQRGPTREPVAQISL
jgi:hypothetical protein